MPITALKLGARLARRTGVLKRVPEGGMPITALKRGRSSPLPILCRSVPEGGMPITALKPPAVGRVTWRSALSQRGACRSRH